MLRSFRASAGGNGPWLTSGLSMLQHCLLWSLAAAQSTQRGSTLIVVAACLLRLPCCCAGGRRRRHSRPRPPLLSRCSSLRAACGRCVAAWSSDAPTSTARPVRVRWSRRSWRHGSVARSRASMAGLVREGIVGCSLYWNPSASRASYIPIAGQSPVEATLRPLAMVATPACALLSASSQASQGVTRLSPPAGQYPRASSPPPLPPARHALPTSR